MNEWSRNPELLRCQSILWCLWNVYYGLSVKTLYVYYNSLSIDMLITDIIYVNFQLLHFLQEGEESDTDTRHSVKGGRFIECGATK